MKKVITILLVLVSLFSAKKGWAYYNKYSDALRIKVGVEGFSFPKLDLSSLLSDLVVNISLGIKNYSSSTFLLEQVSIDVFSIDGILVAEQKAPLNSIFKIRANDNNLLPIDFYISKSNTHALVKQAGGIGAVSLNHSLTGKYGIPLTMKGFIKSEGLTIDINETIEV